MLIRSTVSSVLVAAALASAARAESDSRARAVIQGKGKDVTIVYRAPSEPARSLGGSRAADPLGEALRRKKDGADDDALIAYLRQNEAAMPDVVDAGVLRRLRQAGAGDSVIAAISTLAAVDIGRTSDDSGSAPALRETPTVYGGAHPDLVGMGYPFYGGGYGGFSGGGLVGHRGSHGFRDRTFFHFKQPLFHPGRHFMSGRPMPHGGRGRGAAHGMR